MRRTRLLVLLTSLAAAALIIAVMRLEVSRASASIDSANEIIQLVNQLRRANGLQPYKVNQALMAAAQAHSEYQAAQGSITHTGQGGSRPRDRAVAYGYGDGGAVSVSENIAGGVNLAASEAVSWWQGDNLHLTTMLSPNYQDVGVGVAASDDTIYYTLDVGYVSGSAPPAADSTSPASTPSRGTPGATQIAAAPIIIATPRSDGVVVHMVEQGQVLWNIAAAYRVTLAELLALNNLTDRSVIFPGDKLLIRQAEATEIISATQTLSATATTLPPSNTPHPTNTPKMSTPTAATAAAMLAKGNDVSSQPPDGTGEESSTRAMADPVLILIGVLVVIGTGLVLAGNLMKRQIREKSDSQQV